MTESIFVSVLAVVLAEMGDKTQLLALLLAARFRRPLPIVLGILVATLLNHGLAGALGAWITATLTPDVLKYILIAGFWAMAVWMLIPDKEDGGLLDNPWIQKFGVFGTTLVTFFLAEMGDKTQIATVGLAAHYANAYAVVFGTTIGMLIADVPEVFIGNTLAKKLPIKLIHISCALLFFALGLAAFFVS